MTGPLSWAVREIAEWVGGSLSGDGAAAIRAVATDSRRLPDHALFVAIEGERFDGHDFASQALRRGALAVLVAAGRGSGLEPRIEVGDTLTALRDLAAVRRAELDVPVVAVTGSTGKTSTKDMLRSVLPGAWASPASYNNEVGVPLTVLGTPEGTRFLVAEVGSRGVGHIAWLAPAVRPNVGVITNLGLVHLETFGTPEKLAAAKWELVEGLEPGGIAVLPADEPRLARYHAGETVTFGDHPGADIWFEAVDLDDRGSASFSLRTAVESHRVTLAMAGRHQPWNAVAAAGAALALGMPLDAVSARLGSARGSPGRMEIHHGSITIVNDAYNANPDSMEAAMRTVAAMPGRHVAVVGLMAELGPSAQPEHERIGSLARDLGFAVVVVVGDEPGLAKAAGAAARSVADADEAALMLSDLLRDGDVVLVKASHAVGLEALADRLVREVAR